MHTVNGHNVGSYMGMVGRYATGRVKGSEIKNGVTMAFGVCIYMVVKEEVEGNT